MARPLSAARSRVGAMMVYTIGRTQLIEQFHTHGGRHGSFCQRAGQRTRLYSACQASRPRCARAERSTARSQDSTMIWVSPAACWLGPAIIAICRPGSPTPSSTVTSRPRGGSMPRRPGPPRPSGQRPTASGGSGPELVRRLAFLFDRGAGPPLAFGQAPSISRTMRRQLHTDFRSLRADAA